MLRLGDENDVFTPPFGNGFFQESRRKITLTYAARLPRSRANNGGESGGRDVQLQMARLYRSRAERPSEQNGEPNSGR